MRQFQPTAVAAHNALPAGALPYLHTMTSAFACTRIKRVGYLPFILPYNAYVRSLGTLVRSALAGGAKGRNSPQRFDLDSVTDVWTTAEYVPSWTPVCCRCAKSGKRP
jgi:hypothetical protein